MQVVSVRHVLMVAYRCLRHGYKAESFRRQFGKYSGFDEAFVDCYVLGKKTTTFLVVTVDSDVGSK